jgi:16S rRNA (guanine966-N2)-methyltransferase
LNEVRIIGGKWKRRKLEFPDRPTLRPTPNRLRETLFNWLAMHLDAANCLDLFAGSGALGFEALSRGAAAVTLVDNDAATVRALTRTRQVLTATNCTIVHATAATFLRETVAQWDIVFLDPPFASSLLAQIMTLLRDSAAVHEDTIVYVEASARETLDLGHWQVEKRSKAGEVQALLLRRD